MPYEVTDNQTGRIAVFDNPPTDKDLQEAFGSVQSPASQPAKRMTAGDIANIKTDVDNVPEWGRKNPTLYGVAGAAAETAKPVLEALGLVGGGIGATALSGGNPVVGVAGAGAGYAGARRINQALDLALGNKQPETVGQGFANTARDVVEGGAMEAGGQALNKGIAAAINALPKRTEYRLIESALKPSTTIKQSQRDKVYETMMKENIPVSSRGLKKTQTNIKVINQEIDDMIKAADSEGSTVERDAVLGKLQELRNKYAATKALPDEYVKEVDSVMDQFSTRPAQIGAAQAQEFKKDLYKELSGFYEKFQRYGQPKPQEWGEVRATLASGLRQELSDLIPELSALNARDKSNIEVQRVLERAVNRINNQNLLKLIGSVIGSGGDGFSLKRYLAATISDHPWVKSKVAVAVRNARLKPNRAGAYATGAGIGKASVPELPEYNNTNPNNFNPIDFLRGNAEANE